MPANAKVRRDGHALMGEVICHRQALDAPGNGAWPADGIADEVHTPGLVDRQSSHQRHAHINTFGLLAFPDTQPFSGVDAVHPLVIDVWVLGAQNVVDHAVTPAPPSVGGLHDLLAQLFMQEYGVLGWR